MLEQTARRIILSLMLYLSCAFNVHAAIAINAVRVWPAQDYTRITIESSKAIRYNQFSIRNPERLVIDLEQVDINDILNSLNTKIGSDDPYIKSARIGQFKPGTVRLVLDLKTEIKPQMFNLKPVADYGHRLVLDVYPAQPADPILTLLQTSGIPVQTAASQPASAPSATSRLPMPTENRMHAPSVTEKPPAPPVQNGKRMLIIAVDAGHGGEDPGAHGRRGSQEKDVTLAIARKLKEQIDATPNMRAMLIRDGDYFISLGGRVSKARKAQADLFVSVHADAFVKPNARGSSVFALSERGATSASARWLAKKENEADMIGGVNIAVQDPYLAHTLLDLSLTATISDSLKLAKHVLGELGGINKLHRGKVEQAGFAVLKSPDIPSILVETAFISNPEEEKRLTDNDYQEKMAKAILSGIKRYFSRNPPLAKQKLALE